MSESSKMDKNTDKNESDGNDEPQMRAGSAKRSKTAELILLCHISNVYNNLILFARIICAFIFL